jgi:hypothetical protein
MDVEELNDLDLSYTPPLSSPWDPIQMAAQAYSVRLAESHPITEAIPRATVKSQTQNLPNL